MLIRDLILSLSSRPSVQVGKFNNYSDTCILQIYMSNMTIQTFTPLTPRSNPSFTRSLSIFSLQRYEQNSLLTGRRVYAFGRGCEEVTTAPSELLPVWAEEGSD